jgi:hypothetical protein
MLGRPNAQLADKMIRQITDRKSSHRLTYAVIRCNDSIGEVWRPPKMKIRQTGMMDKQPRSGVHY